MGLNKIVVVGLSIACLAMSQSPKVAQERVPKIAATLRSEHGTARSGAPITLKATLVNQSDHDITIGYDRNRGLFEVDVFDESGKRATDKRPGYHNGRLDLEEFARTSTPEQVIKSGLLTGNIVWTTLKPGATLAETIDVAKAYDMTKPGVYKIVTEHADPETKEIVKSNTVDITVVKAE